VAFRLPLKTPVSRITGISTLALREFVIFGRFDPERKGHPEGRPFETKNNDYLLASTTPKYPSVSFGPAVKNN